MESPELRHERPGFAAGLASSPVAIAAVMQVSLFFYYVDRNLILQPYWDMLSHVIRYVEYRDTGNWLVYLWEPHVQHRHIWIRLLTAFDVEAFSGVGYPFVVVAVCCLLTTAWLFWVQVRRMAAPALKVAAPALAVMLVLTSVAAVDAATPINTIYPQALLFSVLALILFDKDPDAGHGPRVDAQRVAALLCAIGAAFANTAALVLWPILAWMAWRIRDTRWLMTVSIPGALFIAIYVHGLPLSDRSVGSLGLADRLNYFLTFMGLPWTRAAVLSVPGRVLGAVLALVSAWMVFKHARYRPDCGCRSRLVVGLILFSLGCAILAAMGRADDRADVLVPVRYAVLLSPLHVALLMVASQHVRRHRRVVQASAMALAGALLATQLAAGEAAVTTTRTMRDMIQRFLDGETNQQMTTVVSDDLEEARRDSNAIREAGLYLTVK